MLLINTKSQPVSKLVEFICDSITDKNKEQILATLASLKAQGIIYNYGNVYTDSKSIHFSVQPFYPILPYFKFDVAT